MVDTPILGRVGIQIYRNSDGSIRREFRPPESVFDAASLESFVGKPVTIGHPSTLVNSKSRNVVGSIAGDAFRDGDNVRARIIVHSDEAVDMVESGQARELSLGYTVDIEDVSGVYNGERYDCVQKNIRINHVAIVKKGRAGVARFNLDGEEMNLDEVKARLDAVTAERDQLRNDAEKLAVEIRKQVEKDVKRRLEIEATANKFGVIHTDRSDEDVMKAVIAKALPSMRLDGQSAEYVRAAFDIAKDVKVQAVREVHNDSAHNNMSAISDALAFLKKNGG